MNRIKYILSIILLGFVVALSGQEGTLETAPDTLMSKILAMPAGDSIILRWVPTSLEAWEFGNEVGYTLRRSTLSDGDRLYSASEVDKSEIILSNQLRPMSEPNWQASLNQDDEWEVLAAGTLYGEIDQFLDNDGLSPASLINRDISRNNMFAFAFHASNHSMNAAKKLGLAYVDNTTQIGYRYLYTIQFNTDIQSLRNAVLYLSADRVLIRENRWASLPQVDTISSIFGDSLVDLSWSHRKNVHDYVSYNVERSSDGVSFEKINTAPIIPGENRNEEYRASYKDSLDNNEDTYYYRIQGHSPFGFEGPYSEIVSGSGVENIELSAPFLRITSEIEPGRLMLGWQFDKENNDKIKGFVVSRSREYNGYFLPLHNEILPPETRVTFDESPIKDGYYKVDMIDVEGKRYESIKRLVQLEDVTPPAQPQGLTCEKDTSLGFITLNWEGNTEEDLEGYRIFSSYTEDDGYTDLTTYILQETSYSFETNLKRNGENLFFKIMALDHRTNNSLKSESCTVKLLDIKPPSPARVREVKEDRKHIDVTVARSPDGDAVKHVVYRRQESNPEWTQVYVDTARFRTFTFKDSIGLKPNVDYLYKTSAEDENGQVSYSNEMTGRLWDEGLALNIEEFRIFKKNSNGYEAQWKYFPSDVVSQYIIYRAVSENDWKVHKIVKGEDIAELERVRMGGLSQYSLPLKFIKDSQDYQYKMRAKLINGQRSPMTDVIVLETN